MLRHDQRVETTDKRLASSHTSWDSVRTIVICLDVITIGSAKLDYHLQNYTGPGHTWNRNGVGTEDQQHQGAPSGAAHPRVDTRTPFCVQHSGAVQLFLVMQLPASKLALTQKNAWRIPLSPSLSPPAPLSLFLNQQLAHSLSSIPTHYIA